MHAMSRGGGSPVATGSLKRFFLTTYTITWVCFLAAWFFSRSPAPVASGLRWPLLILGSFAPSAVAVWLTARREGGDATRTLLRRLLAWRVSPWWYLFALGYMAAVKLCVALVYRAAMGEWPRFGHEAWYAILMASLVASVLGGPLGEEIGWRGYALPRLEARVGLARASVVLGLIWAGWHLPLFFIPGMDQTGQSLPVYVLQVTALSVAFAWLYAHSKGSLLLAVLLHTAVNQSKDLVPSIVATATNPLAPSRSLVAWLTVGILWVCAGYFLVRMQKGAPTRSP
jgi:membrane protease YdiL (CAAX protease family)